MVADIMFKRICGKAISFFSHFSNFISQFIDGRRFSPCPSPVCVNYVRT